MPPDAGRAARAPARRRAGGQDSSRANRAYLRSRRNTAAIPVKADQTANHRKKGSHCGRPPSFDHERYKDCTTVERCFNKLRQHRGAATRYDKRDRIHQGTVDVASIRIRLRDPVS